MHFKSFMGMLLFRQFLYSDDLNENSSLFTLHLFVLLAEEGEVYVAFRMLLEVVEQTCRISRC